MLRALARLFEVAPQPEREDEPRRLHLAAAILLFEVARSDHQVDAHELVRLERVLREQWSLDDSELQELLEVAGREAELAASLHEQVATVNRNYSREQKYALLLGLWQVACADGGIHHYEEHLVRRLADLLYIPHSEFIRAKHQALEQA